MKSAIDTMTNPTHSRFSPLLFLLVAMLTACARTTAPGSAGGGPTGSLPPTEATSSGTRPPPPAPALDAPPAPKPIATKAAPMPKSQLGGPCTGPATAPTEPTWNTRMCNGGKVVGAFRPGDTAAAPLPNAKILAKTRDDWKVASYIATDGQLLRVRIITCANCRRIMGWSFEGHPHEMTADQQKAIQRFAGLDASVPPLTSTDGWAAQPMPTLP